jgi:hypothetical protein
VEPLYSPSRNRPVRYLRACVRNENSPAPQIAVASPAGATGFSNKLMEITTDICCPWCGQNFELVIDTSAGSQQFTTDCEVCCRPMSVSAECEPGEILSLDVQSE